jgi:hypothetical protein
MQTGYLNSLTELEIAILAKAGDKNAVELLWVKYRKPMANVFWSIFTTPEERESEAADVFIHYIKNLFDPEKEENQKQNWTFFSYLYSGMIGRRSKLLKERVYLSYDEQEDLDSESESKALNAEKVCLFNKDLFTRYGPEDAVMNLDFETKVGRLQDSINRLQKIKADYFSRIMGRIAADKMSAMEKEV